jgi:hypothetical protein
MSHESSEDSQTIERDRDREIDNLRDGDVVIIMRGIQ